MKLSSKLLMSTLGLFALLGSASGQAAVVSNVVNQDFSGSSISFGYGPIFTLSDNGSGFPSPVSITTTADSAVTSLSLFGPTVPTSYFDPVRGGTLVFDGNFTQYSSFLNPTAIDFSATPTYIGLRVTVDNQFHYGYAQFQGTFLKAYAFESLPGVGIAAGSLSPVPEPESYALMLAGLGVMGFVARKRMATKVVTIHG